MSTVVKMTAPVNGGGDSKRLDVLPIPAGFQLCTFYGIAMIGTHPSNFGDKNSVMLGFEFPQEKRVFYEGDDAKPSASFVTKNFSMHEKSGLRALVHGMNGNLTDEQAENFDLGSLIGNNYVAMMEHTTSSDGTRIYSNIKSLAKLTDQTRKMFSLEPNQAVERINDIFFFDKSQGYMSENFKNLPSFIRGKIKDSIEGKQHKLSGGNFAEPERNNQEPAKRKLKMLVNDWTYEQYSQNWTDEQLVENGKAEWIDNTPAPAPKPVSSAAAPPPSSAPSPSAPLPSNAPKPIEEAKVFVLNDPSWNLEEMLASGWTTEKLIEHGHGNFQ